MLWRGVLFSCSGSVPGFLEAVEASPQVLEDPCAQHVMTVPTPGFVLDLQLFLGLSAAEAVQRQKVFCLAGVKNSKN